MCLYFGKVIRFYLYVLIKTWATSIYNSFVMHSSLSHNIAKLIYSAVLRRNQWIIDHFDFTLKNRPPKRKGLESILCLVVVRHTLICLVFARVTILVFNGFYQLTYIPVISFCFVLFFGGGNSKMKEKSDPQLEKAASNF